MLTSSLPRVLRFQPLHQISEQFSDRVHHANLLEERLHAVADRVFGVTHLRTKLFIVNFCRVNEYGSSILKGYPQIIQ